MASLSANTTIKINGAVSAAATNITSGTQTLYTAPANGYAIINATLAHTTGNAGSIDLRVGGQLVMSTYTAPSGPFLNSNGFVSASTPFVSLQDTGKHSFTERGIYVGPGQSVELFPSGNLVGSTARISGVEFINTP